MAALMSPQLLRRHHHSFHHDHQGKVLMKQKVACSLLLWVLGLISVVVLTALYSPHPFRVSPLVLFDGSDDHQDITVQQSQASCDLSIGRWVRDPSSRPAYTSNCSAMPESKNCAKYGKDMDYINWRWKPHDCELPHFDPRRFLDRVRGKTMAFVGDSLARNQFDSLICLLSEVEPPTNVYQDKDNRFITWHFRSYNFTLMKLWTKFLVSESEHMINGSITGVFDLHMDKIDPSWSHSVTRKVDFLVISSGHWFFRKLYLYDNNTLIGCVFCSEPDVTTINIETVIQKVFRTALEYILSCRTCIGITTFVRTFSPAHFEQGTWNDGGRCNRTGPYNEEDADVSGTYWDMSRMQLEEVGRARKKLSNRKSNIVPLDITMAMFMRADGHPGSHWNNKWANGYSDCVHWCLPGPIDLWNQILSAEMDKLMYIQ